MAAGKKGKAKTVDEAEKERLEEEARLRELELEEERQRKIEEVKFSHIGVGLILRRVIL